MTKKTFGLNIRIYHEKLKVYQACSDDDPRVTVDVLQQVHTKCWNIIISIQSNLNGSNIFGTLENCSRHGKFEPLRVNHGVRSGSK